jgi:dephospho-CoA kinase
MKIIGLTGNIASGKSSVSALLRELGAEVIDMDRIGKEIQDMNYKDVISKIRLVFGEGIIHNNKIDRRMLAQIVFSNSKALKNLNGVMIPLMTEKLNALVLEYKLRNARLVVIDAAILFEAGWDKLVDATWLVYASKEVQLKRLMLRESISEKEALKRINSQMDIDTKIKNADVVINNSGDFEEVKRDVIELWKKLVSI